MDDPKLIVLARVQDRSKPHPGSDKILCGNCGQICWISSELKSLAKELDEVEYLCMICFEDGPLKDPDIDVRIVGPSADSTLN